MITLLSVRWVFSEPPALRRLAQSIKSRFSSSNVEGVRALCTAEMGLAQLTAWDVREELINGELIAISLDDVQDQMLAVWALFPTSRHLPVRVITFLDVLKQAMQSINMSGAP